MTRVPPSPRPWWERIASPHTAKPDAWTRLVRGSAHTKTPRAELLLPAPIDPSPTPPHKGEGLDPASTAFSLEVFEPVAMSASRALSHRQSPCGDALGEGERTHQTPAREKSSPSVWGISSSGSNPDSRGAGKGPWWWKKWVGAFTRAPPVRDTLRLPGASGPPSCKTRRKPWAVSSRSILRGPNPAFSHPHVSDAAGMCRAGICGDAASTDRDAARTGCGSNAAG